MMGLCFDKNLPLRFVFIPFPCYSKAEKKGDLSRGPGAMKVATTSLFHQEVNKQPLFTSSLFNDLIFSEILKIDVLLF